ncbi:MAG: hypothetical protein EAZ51_03495 [Sphingobacteriales bacterium]|nr:MAG: hypothetical protein EAZ64_07180 [Sphingobacteriales bacterium]TAF81894.1 MAG: hypothetical protein EAZ51_03495 [Sphingobacteriales bacterium]
MAKLYNISEWNEQSWWNTGGTRDKKIYLNPEDGELYYFKQSFKKGQRDYKYEFWSEIIASEIGELLGFDILPYHIAIRGNVVGCISKSMINQASEELIEGGKYLQAFDNTFKPENIKLRNQYNFDLILNALVSFKKEKHLKELAETIVFDALIGNSDRHQENWAIINVHTIISEGVAQVEKGIITGEINEMPNWLKKIVKALYTVKGKIRPEIQTARLMLPKITRFAPIYDSGCSFGRELDDERVKNMLNNEQEIQKYIAKGQAEIHWESNKISHFELIVKLLESEGLKDIVLDPLKRITEQFDPKKVEQIVLYVDKELFDLGNSNYLPKERKELVLKLLTLRLNKLREIYSQYK